MRFIFTAAAERALEHASNWSLGAGRDELGAEPLLLGLLSEPECRAAVMLAGIGVDISVVLKQWPELTRTTPPINGPPRRKTFSSDLVCSFQLAAERLSRLPQPLEMTTEHILLGLTTADHDVSLWLRRLGLDPDALTAVIRKLHGLPAEDDSSMVDDIYDDCQGFDVENNSRGLTAPGEKTPITPNNSRGLTAPGEKILDSTASRGPLAPGYCDTHLPNIGVLRVIDAAANRAREAIRVVEDYTRLVLDDRHLTRLCKQLRHDLTGCLGAIPPHLFLSARETQSDVGTALNTAGEARRETVRDVLQANFARLQEALRSLEEFGKLLDPAMAAASCGGSCTATSGAIEQLSPQPANMAAAIKQLRYRAYTLHRAVEITGHAIERLASVRLYVLLDGRQSPEEFERLALSLIDAGADAIQLRDKRLGDRELLERARRLVAVMRGTPALAIVNDRPDLAALAGADGVHVGQEELSVKDARRIVGPDALVGVSAHSLEQARQAVLDGADYIGVGPVFPSETKRFEAYPGVELVRAVSAEIRLPAFAIGGINRANVAAVLAAGAARIVVGSAITSNADPARAAKELADIVANAGCA